MPDFKQFPLPDTAEGLTEAEILTWHVAAGDEVTVNQIVVEVETAKAAVELPCPWAGVISELHAAPGDTVHVGAPLLTIDLDPSGAGGSTQPTATTNGATPASAAEEEMQPLVGYGSKAASTMRRPRKAGSATPATSAAEPAAPAGQAPAASTEHTATNYVPLAKPPVRKLAKELGVDLRALTGPGGDAVITREDVKAAAESTVDVSATSTDFQTRERRVPIRGVRKATAEAMVRSAFTAPHVTEFLTVDVTPLLHLAEQVKSRSAFADIKLTPLAFAAKAVCLAVTRTPEVNATWDEATNEIVYKDYVHLGIAAATPRGLVVPKIRDADQKSLSELAGAIGELTATAREGATPPTDMLGGTFTITNVGVFGVDTGTPIINPGESAILAFGAIKDTPWVVDGQVVPRKVLQLALSFDHRLVDGEQGSRFLADVGGLLADPALAITY